MNENFLKWFNKSKVVSKDKKPLVVYHGSYNLFEVFNTCPLIHKSYSSLGETAIGSCFSESREIAQSYPLYRKHSEHFLYEVFLSIQNPKKFTTIKAVLKDLLLFYEKMELNLAKSSERLENVLLYKEYLISQGYDGITYLEGPPHAITKNKSRVWVAFNERQIKSVNNNGKFNPISENIYK